MEWGVRPGDQVVPYFEFQVMKNEKCYLQKHGITESVVQLNVLKQLKDEKHPNVVYGVGTVQEEVGLRGAKHLRIILNQISRSQ